jgi:hypothetical protein
VREQAPCSQATGAATIRRSRRAGCPMKPYRCGVRAGSNTSAAAWLRRNARSRRTRRRKIAGDVPDRRASLPHDCGVILASKIVGAARVAPGRALDEFERHNHPCRVAVRRSPPSHRHDARASRAPACAACFATEDPLVEGPRGMGRKAVPSRRTQSPPLQGSKSVRMTARAPLLRRACSVPARRATSPRHLTTNPRHSSALAAHKCSNPLTRRPGTRPALQRPRP